MDGRRTVRRKTPGNRTRPTDQPLRPAPLVEPVKPVSLVEPVEPRILDLGIPGDFDAAHEGHTWKCGLVPR